MTPEFNYNGLQIETFDEIYQRLVTGLKSIYGNEINVDLDSPDGQRLAITAQLVLDLQTFALNLYNQMDANLAAGEWQNKLMKFAALTRRAATRSQVDVTITTDRFLTLPVDYKVQDDLGQIWLTTEEIELITGANVITLFAEFFGDYSAASGTVETPVTIIPGVLSVTNATASLDAQDEETDEAARIRRYNGVENPAYSTTGSLMAKLANLPNVSDVVVYENDQDTTDVDKAIAPHTIWVVIEGGTVADIVELMAKQKTGGTGVKGSQSSIYTEIVTRPDGSTFNIAHEMKFDRPVAVDLYVRFKAHRVVSTSPIDLDQMKNKIVGRKFHIGENLKASTLYATIYPVGTNFTLSDLEVSDDGVTWTDENLISAWDGKFTVDPANITITEII